MKRIALLLSALVVGIVIMGISLVDSAQGRTIYFDHNMIASKNLTDHGVIKYHVTGNAHKYNNEINVATKKWNYALGKKVFVQTNSLTDSRLVITKATITPGLAGVAEINSGVIALNSDTMNRYSESKREAVLIHELGHTLGTKDLYLYPEANLRSLFTRATIMGGDYSTHIGKFDADLAKWSLKHTTPVSDSEFNGYRHDPHLYFQKYVV